ncbi:unnamed protein product, partial [Trichobilharzia regenti]
DLRDKGDERVALHATERERASQESTHQSRPKIIEYNTPIISFSILYLPTGVFFYFQSREAYLNKDERCVLDWHLANLEFANATELHNLSLRHWDQDDLFEFNGEHCVLQDGYGSVTDSLAQYITSGQTIVSHQSSSASSRQRDHQTSVATSSLRIPMLINLVHLSVFPIPTQVSIIIYYYYYYFYFL